MNSKRYRVYGLVCRCSAGCAGMVRYVGLTRTELPDRLKTHKCKAKERRLPVHHWIMKHGAANIQIELIMELENEEDMADVEVGLIEYLRQQPGCLNVADGGLGGDRYWSKRPACSRGHSFAPDSNTWYWYKGQRRCRACAAYYAREKRAREKKARESR